jgi:3-methylcrotonyl-CoA carboxylase alpha subunit
VLDLPGRSLVASAENAPGGGLLADIAGVRVHAAVVRNARVLTIFTGGITRRLELKEFDAVADEEAGGSLTAPMPGSVIDVLVESGQKVEKGQPLMILEAMKMEHTITAPSAGVVAQVLFARGEQVKEGDQLLQFEKESTR